MNRVDGRLCALLALCAGCSTYFTYANFTSAFPTLSLDLKTSKADVEALAAALASSDEGQFETRPLMRPGADADDDEDATSYMSAASFGGDEEVQHYVELAGGGNEAFKAMIARVSAHYFLPPSFVRDPDGGRICVYTQKQRSMCVTINAFL